VWARAFGDGGEQQGANVSLDTNANVLVTGWLIDDASSKGMDFGTGKIFPPSGLSGEMDYRPDVYILRLSADGMTTRFALRAGDVEAQSALGSTTDAAGNIVVTGFYESELQYDSSPDGTLQQTWGEDIILLKAGP
jgi:hypothetical protein